MQDHSITPPIPHDEAPAVAPDVSPERRAAVLRAMGRVAKPRPVQLHRKACILARESDPDLQDSIPAQLEAGHAYAIEHGLHVQREHADGISGLAAAGKQYQDMMRRCELREYTDVIMLEFQRFGRDDARFVTDMRKLMKLDVVLHDVTLGGPIPEEEVARLAYEANRESRRTSVRTFNKMKYLAKKGQRFGRAPFGYTTTDKPGVWVEHEVYADAYRELVRRFLGGESLHAVTRWLNAEHGLRKEVNTVRRMLKNPAYMGIVVWGRRCNSRLHTHEQRPDDQVAVGQHTVPLLDEKTWNALQRRLREGEKMGEGRANGRRDLLKGLLRCGGCGGTMIGHTCHRGYDEYVCQICQYGRSMRGIDWAVLDAMGEALPTGPIEMRIDATEPDNELGELRAEVERQQSALDALTAERVELARAATAGRIPWSDYHAALAAMEQEQALLRSQLERAQAALDEASLEESSQECVATLTVLGDSIELPFAVPYPCTAVVTPQLPPLTRLLRRVLYDPGARTVTLEPRPRVTRQYGLAATTRAVPQRMPRRSGPTTRERP